MSLTQKRILTGLALVTALVCAFALIAIRAAFTEPPPEPIPTLSPTLAPTATPEPTATPRPDVGDKYGALAICKKFVKDQLIAPRDAKWPGLFDDGPQAIQLDDDTWRVESWVDAANRLGVHIRTEYTCEVRYLGDDRWQLESLNINSEP